MFFQANDSSKKRTNEFSFTTMQHVFVRFLEEIEAGQDRNNLFLKVLDTQWCSYNSYFTLEARVMIKT